MSSTAAAPVVIESDEEPQAKKLKPDTARSPLVVLNGEGNIKKKQLTLKDMVSPKAKQTNLKTMLTSPRTITKPTVKSTKTTPITKPTVKSTKTTPITKPTNKSTKITPITKPTNKSTKITPITKRTNKSTKTTPITKPTNKSTDNPADKTPPKDDMTTPSRGVKRKSTFSGEDETNKTPVKQAMKESARNTDKTENLAKIPEQKETISEIPEKKENLTNNSGTKENPAKIPEEKETTAATKDLQKLTLESVLKRSNDRPSSSGKEPAKKKFGDYKKKGPADKKQGGDDQPKITSVIPPGKSAPVFPPKPITKPKTASPAEALQGNASSPKGAPQEITREYPKRTPQKEENVGSEKENEAPECVTPVREDTDKVHVDGEKPGPSGINRTPRSEKKPKVLSFKQKRIQEEREKKRKELADEKEKKRLEREKEKEARDQAKKAEQSRKDAEKVAREKAREDTRLKKEEEKKSKDMEREAERSKREEKEAERKRKLLENGEGKRQREEEQERKKQKKLKEQEKFKSFFVVKKPTAVAAPTKVETLEKKFRDFIITPNMFVAPITRTDPIKSDILASQTTWTLNKEHIKAVIQEMKAKDRYKTDDLSSDLEIISISSKKQIKVKTKILGFYENHRPAYRGSWSKKSAVIGPRRPFGQDKNLLDYDYDSDEDWEEEEEGEDITSEKEDEKEDEKEEKEDDDDDDGFFVPHGYLSDDEGDEDGELSEEAKRKRVERRRKQFDEEQKSKESGILRAKIVGPVWQDEIACGNDAVKLLAQFKAVWTTEPEEAIDPFARIQPVAVLETNNETKKALPVEGYSQLIRFMHGSPIGMSRAVETFQEMWHSDGTRNKVSKRQLTALIPTLMKKCMRPGNFMKLCWYASDDVLLRHGLPALVGLYCEAPEQQFVAPAPPAPPATNTLLKFTKTLSAEEALAQLKLQQAAMAAHQQQLLQTASQQQFQAPQPPKPSTPSITAFLAPRTASNVNGNVSGNTNGNTNGNVSANTNGNTNGNVSANTNGNVSGNLLQGGNVKRRIVLTPVGGTPTSVQAPRRVALLPIKCTSTTPINIDEDSNEDKTGS